MIRLFHFLKLFEFNYSVLDLLILMLLILFNQRILLPAYKSTAKGYPNSLCVLVSVVFIQLDPVSPYVCAF